MFKRQKLVHQSSQAGTYSEDEHQVGDLCFKTPKKMVDKLIELENQYQLDAQSRLIQRTQQDKSLKLFRCKPYQLSLESHQPG